MNLYFIGRWATAVTEKVVIYTVKRNDCPGSFEVEIDNQKLKVDMVVGRKLPMT